MKAGWIALTTLALLGCSKPTATPSVPAGTKIGNQHSFWGSMLPAYRPGMSWSYRRVLVGNGTLTTDSLSIEVASVEKWASLKVTGWMEPATVSLQAPTEAILSPSATYESLGTEDVTVPYGSFKQAAKFRFDPQYTAQAVGSETLLWFVQGVGLVKTASIRQSGEKSTVVTQELTAFKK